MSDSPPQTLVSILALLCSLLFALSACSAAPIDRRLTNVEVEEFNTSQSAVPDRDRVRLAEPEQVERPTLAVWPFAYTSTVYTIDGPWLIAALLERETAAQAAIVTRAVIRQIVSDPLNRYTVLERLDVEHLLSEQRQDIESTDDLASAALQLGSILGADYLVVGSCIPGVNQGEYSVDVRLIQTHGLAEIVAARSGVCQPCDTQRLENLARDLASELIAPWPVGDDYDEPILPGSE